LQSAAVATGVRRCPRGFLAHASDDAPKEPADAFDESAQHGADPAEKVA
jgi:hypothetical protein